jgi:outer membrane protein TolC
MLANSERALELARTRIEADGADPSSVLQIQISLVGIRIALVDVRCGRLVQRIRLHLALGGSFEQTSGRRVIREAVAE